MRKLSSLGKLACLISTSTLIACASNPDDMEAAYVSPLKYKNYDCDQIALEMDHVGQRTEKLYQRLNKDRNNDNLQMGVGLVLFWPALFFLEGGDGPEATEYAQLKGEFEALRQNSVTRKCGLNIDSPSEVIESAQAEAKAAAVEVVEENDAKYTAKVKAIAEEQNCREAVSLQSVTNESESWALECGDGKNVFIRCFDDECYIKK